VAKSFSKGARQKRKMARLVQLKVRRNLRRENEREEKEKFGHTKRESVRVSTEICKIVVPGRRTGTSTGRRRMMETSLREKINQPPWVSRNEGERHDIKN